MTDAELARVRNAHGTDYLIARLLGHIDDQAAIIHDLQQISEAYRQGRKDATAELADVAKLLRETLAALFLERNADRWTIAPDPVPDYPVLFMPALGMPVPPCNSVPGEER